MISTSINLLYRSFKISQIVVRKFPKSINFDCQLQNVRHFKQIRPISMTIPNPKKDELEITFVRASGEKIKAYGKPGDTLLDVVVNNNVDLDGFGACEGTLTCSTCHLIFKPEDYAKLPDKPGDEELDMLDLAFDLTDTSRLGCQITLTKDMNGLHVHVPATVNDARS